MAADAACLEAGSTPMALAREALVDEPPEAGRDDDAPRLFVHALYWFVVTAILGALYSVSTVKGDLLIWAAAFGSAYFLNPLVSPPAENERSGQSRIAKSQRQRLYYLDNLKVMLTALVVVHHIACGHGVGDADGINIGGYPGLDWFRRSLQGLKAVNQSYFMVLFMFISGYFTPPSYDRKGAFLFLQDKFKRLALPLLFWVFILNPLLVLFLHRVVDGDRSYSEYQNGMGPPWFVKALLLFNVLYCLSAGTKPVTMNLPSYWKIIGLTASAQLIEAVRAITGMNDLVGWAGVPLASGVVQIMAFYGGCVAYRNQWLDALLAKRSDRRHTIGTYAGACIGTLFVFAAGYFSAQEADVGRRLKDGQHQSLMFDVLMALGCVGLGIAGSTINIAMLDFFGRFLQKTTAVSRFLAAGAYTVYLIHPLVWSGVLWSFINILKVSQGHTSVIVMKGNTPFNVTSLSVWELVASFVYTVVLSSLILWPLAWAIAKLPGFRNVL